MKPLAEVVAAVTAALGIDKDEIVRRKAFLDLTESDVDLLKAVHGRLQGSDVHFVDEFYAHLLRFDETRRFIPDTESLEHLKRTQSTYFESLTAGDYGAAYVSDRLRVGVAHQRIGLEPKWYVGAYGKYLAGLLPQMWRLLRDDPQVFLDTYSALQKVVLLDMSLAIDTYIHADRRAVVGLKRYAEDIIASLPAGLIVLDDSLRVLQVNRTFLELFGMENGTNAAGRDLEEILPLPELRSRANDVLAQGTAVQGMDAALGEKRLRLSLNRIHLAEEEEEEEEERLLLAVEDVTEEQRLRDEARAHERRFHDLVQGLDAIVWEAAVVGEEIRFGFVNDYVERLLGYPSRRWLGHEFWPAVVHADDRDAVFEFYNRVLECSDREDGRGERFEIEYRAHRADGGLVWLHDVVHLTAADAGCARLCGVTMEITPRKDLETQLTHLANHDPLTGLPNRRLLIDHLSQALAHAARRERAVGVLFLDLDRFKTINDSLGHGAGDLLLKAVADRLRGCVREGDTVARHGGDEFVIILDDMAHAQDAAHIAQKLLEQVARPFHGDTQVSSGEDFFSTACIGISLYPGDGEDTQTLLKNADAAMYRAKARGGNSYQFFTPEMDTQARMRLSLENALHAALEYNQFKLHYQPQVDLASGEITGVEALLRWDHPSHGLVSPSEFIPLLEETGLIVPVGEWVLREACAQARTWREAGSPWLRVAVNLSARQLRDQSFADSVAQTLADFELDPACLELEITESMVMQQPHQAMDILSRLSNLGVRLAIDDFGTGYSSLSHLKLFPINTIKIDQSFVHDLPDDTNDAAIVQAIIALARALELDVIAEGVETREQRAFLRAYGCDAMQGYFFSRPLPAKELLHLLSSCRQR